MVQGVNMLFETMNWLKLVASPKKAKAKLMDRDKLDSGQILSSRAILSCFYHFRRISVY